MGSDDISVFFEPASIALIGISRKTPSLGQLILENIDQSTYVGPIYLVNPGTDSIRGRECYPTISQIPAAIDLSIIMTPARFVLQSIKESVESGARGIIIITAGFSEVSEQGKQMEAAFLKEIEDGGTRIVGPNSMGTYSTTTHASFSPIPIEQGNVAYLSQSGSILVVAAEHMLPFKLGMSKFISMGNKIDVNENVALEYLYNDPETKIINTYLESFSDPQNIRNLLRRVSRKLPIVMVKGGRTSAGARAASSHTGALAGEHRLIKAVMESEGVILASNIPEQVAITRFLSKYGKIGMGGVAIVSSAGGPSILASDEAVEAGLRLAQLSEQSRAKLSEVVPPQGSYANPIDILAAADEELHIKTVEILLQDPDVAAIIIIIVHPVLIEAQSLLDKLLPYTHQDIPIICAYLGPDFVNFQQNSKVLITGSTKEAITMISGVQKYSEWLQHLKEIEHFGHIKEREHSTTDLKSLLESFGFDFPDELVTSSYDTCLAHVAEIGYPIVLKIAHNQFSHKSDVGGVILNISNLNELRQGWDQIMQIYHGTDIDESNRCVSIQPFYESGIEIALGIVYDEMFGHFLMVGTGGTMIELFEDVAFHPSPISAYSAKKLITQLKLDTLLSGFRNYSPVDRDIVVSKILALDNLIHNNPHIRELDINPLLIFPDGSSVVLDSRVSYHQTV